MPVYHAGDGNQFMGVVELPKGAIVELSLALTKSPMNMRSKQALLEVELVEKINKCFCFTTTR